MHHKILELYSGIGGMHCAWIESGLSGDIVAAVDINTIANGVYNHNFPNINLLNRNIQSLQPIEIKNLNVNTILMSPPCQPFTRNGKYLDSKDPRTNSFTYLIGILKELNNIEYILMENVKGFECSSVRDVFIDNLIQCGFSFQEFLLCSSTIGVPNSRLRYYCIARRSNSLWNFKRKDDIMMSLPNIYEEPFPLKLVIDKNATDEYLIPDKLLKRGNILDICHIESKRSCCFTKAYSHYVEGTGSVYTDATPDMVKSCYELANTFDSANEEFLISLKPLKLRFFTPNEILLLMTFPNKFEFPNSVTRRQCYRLLGNSVNVKVISELLKILFS